MRSPRIEYLYESLSASVIQVTAVFRSSLPVPEILNRFWALQDNLSRLLEAIKDYPTETMRLLERHPDLLRDIANVLERSSDVQILSSLAPVRGSAESIHSSLSEIHEARQALMMAASV